MALSLPVMDRCAIHPDRAAEITCSRCGNFACYECVGASPGRVCAACRLRMTGTTGRAEHVRPLAAALVVHGGLLVLWGLFLAFVGVISIVAPNRSGTSDPATSAAVFAALTFGALVPGALQVAAGVRMLGWHGRTLGLVAIVGGLFALPSCCCVPMPVVLLVWGLFVLADTEVRVRFAERAPGRG